MYDPGRKTGAGTLMIQNYTTFIVITAELLMSFLKYDARVLALQIVEGSEPAFRQFFNMYRDRLFYFAERML